MTVPINNVEFTIRIGIPRGGDVCVDHDTREVVIHPCVGLFGAFRLGFEFGQRYPGNTDTSDPCTERRRF